MSYWTLLARSLRFYWRTHLGVLLGTALGCTVLLGALLVGDSVQATLRRQAEERVGQVRSVLVGGDHFFRERLGGETGSVPVLMLRGSVSGEGGSERANQVQLMGVPEEFWALGPGGAAPARVEGIVARPNSSLARHLHLHQGSTVIVRLEKPSGFSRDAPLSGSDEQTIALRVVCGAVVEATSFGNFGLQANQVPPSTLFLPIRYLQEQLGLIFPAEPAAGHGHQGQLGKVDLLLNGHLHADSLTEVVASKRTLADAELELRPVPVPDAGWELRSSRVFLDPSVSGAAPGGLRSLTYLVNELRAGDRATPYSMATAIDAATAGFLPGGLRDDETVISHWLAEDLGVAVGAKISLKYFVMSERRQLAEQTKEFAVAAVLPMETPQLNRSWMPDFPGLSDKKNCRDWEPGFAMDSTKIRPKDEQYWQTYRGTPKAFITLRAGQGMWGNRWGNLTSIRFPAGTKPEQISAELLQKVTPAQMGLITLPLREQAFAATDVPVPFGQLFLGFSIFLLAAAAVLTGLLFVFSLEQRNEEAGLLLGLGWRVSQVRWLLLGEGAVLAVAGSLLGALGGVAYTWAVLRALGTVWRGAVGAVDFPFSARAGTVLIGIASSIVVAILSMWLASRRQLRQSAHTLLSQGQMEGKVGPQKARRSWTTAVAGGAGIGAAALLLTGHGGETFFSAGALLLIAGIAWALGTLRRTANQTAPLETLTGLGLRNAARRRGRSVATIAVLASGVFMVIAVDAFRLRGDGTPADRQTGTGGFALVAESSSPIYEDLNSSAGLDASGLDARKLAGVRFVPMRVREGDDASCLNLNRALVPRLLGVKPSELAQLNAFRFGGRWKGADGAKKGWALLDSTGGAEPIPAIADEATLEWALQKSLGDVVTYQDERGQPFQVRLVATLAGSILQGSLLISEEAFIRRYPNQGGYRFFLIDAPRGPHGEPSPGVLAELASGLGQRDFELRSTDERLRELQAVENTYLAIFQALGGLGLLLGTAGLAIVVARNVLERRREFGLLEAVGFRAAQMRQLVFAEHRWLIFTGLAIGLLSALVAVWPNLRGVARSFPVVEMGALAMGLLASSLGWTWLATRLALRGDRLSSLRSE